MKCLRKYVKSENCLCKLSTDTAYFQYKMLWNGTCQMRVLNVCIISPAPSSVATSARLMLSQSFLVAITSKRGSALNLPNGLQRKVKLLVLNSFAGGREVHKGHFRLEHAQLHKMQHGSKTDLLIEKRNCLILAVENVAVT